jgi:hypothetical protein
MPLIIKTKDDSKRPHLALTHKELQGGSANGRNVSLLMKSDAAITEDVEKSLKALGLDKAIVNKSMYASKINDALSSAVREAFGDDDRWLYVEDYNDSIVLFCSEGGLFSVDYSLVDGKVTLGDLAKPMSRVISYEPETGEMLLSEDAEDKLEEGIYSLVTKALQNDSTKEHLVEMFKAQELKKSEVEILEQEIKKAVDAAEAILKAQLVEKEAALTKALEEVAAFKAEKLEVVAKARKEKLEAVVSKEEAESLYKATEALPDEAFEAVFKSLGGKAKEEKDSDLFKEKGVSGEGEPKKQEEAGLNLVGELINKSKKQ